MTPIVAWSNGLSSCCALNLGCQENYGPLVALRMFDAFQLLFQCFVQCFFLMVLKLFKKIYLGFCMFVWKSIQQFKKCVLEPCPVSDARPYVLNAFLMLLNACSYVVLSVPHVL